MSRSTLTSLRDRVLVAASFGMVALMIAAPLIDRVVRPLTGAALAVDATAAQRDPAPAHRPLKTADAAR